MRSSVDLPHPEGPRMVMKSLSATVSVVGCSACVGVPPRTPRKAVRLTASIDQLAHQARLQKNSRWFAP